MSIHTCVLIYCINEDNKMHVKIPLYSPPKLKELLTLRNGEHTDNSALNKTKNYEVSNP